MKRYQLNWLLCLVALLAGGCISSEKTMAQPGAMVSFQTFYDELAPYGRWINDPEYGYVWSPDVEYGFQPYATRGYWVMTEYGNTWVSDYAWGWAPFHYGRWLHDDYYGWLWMPGNEWGPAWVAWRSGGGYYGWAPMGPGININISINIPAAHWIFVPQRYITRPYIYNYCVPRTRVVHVYHNTTVINNYYTNNNQTYVYGPRTQEIERHTRSRVRVHQVDHDNRPGRTVVQNGSVRVYRPEVASQRNASPAQAISRGSNPRSNTQVGSNFVERNERRERDNVSERNNIGERTNPAYNNSNRGNTINRSSERNATSERRMEMEQERQKRQVISPRSREHVEVESNRRNQQPQINRREASPEWQPAPSPSRRQPQRSGSESVQPRSQSREQYQPRRQEQPQRQQPQQMRSPRQEQQRPQIQQQSPQQESPRGGNVRSRRD